MSIHHKPIQIYEVCRLPRCIVCAEYTDYLYSVYFLFGEKNSCLQPHPLPPFPLLNPYKPSLQPFPLVMFLSHASPPCSLLLAPCSLALSVARNECKEIIKKILSMTTHCGAQKHPQAPTTHTMTRTNSKTSCGREQSSLRHIEAHGRVTYPVTRSFDHILCAMYRCIDR